MIISTLAIDPNTILIGALVAVVALLLVMLTVERSKRKKAQTRASWLSAQALKATVEAEDAPTDELSASQTHGITEKPKASGITAPERAVPMPQNAIAHAQQKSVAEKRQAPDKTDAAPKYERHLKVEETPARAEAAPSKVKLNEPITNGKVYSDDKLFINELEADDTDVIIVPEKQKVKAPKKAKKQLLDKKCDKLMLNLVVEESYEPLLSKKAPEAPVEDEQKADKVQLDTPTKIEAAEPEGVPSSLPEKSEQSTPQEATKVDNESVAEDGVNNSSNPIFDMANAIGDVSDAFAALVDSLEEKPRKAEKPKDDDEKPSKPAMSAQKEQEKAPLVLEALGEKAKLYADSEDMFDKPPYKRPFNVVPNANAFKDTVTVPTSLTINMKEPVYIDIGEKSESDEKLVKAEREGDVDLNIFMKSNGEKTESEEEKEVSKESLYDVVDVVKPSYEAFEVESSAVPRDSYTVEEAKREPMTAETVDSTKTATASFDEV